MAYISRQQSIDETNRNRTISGGSVDGGASGISGQAAGAAAPSSSSGNVVGIRDYIRANQTGADKLAGQVRDVVNKEGNDVRSALSAAQAGFNNQSSQAATSFNQADANRVAQTGDRTGLDKILAGTYTGPRSLTEAGFRSSVDAELAQAKEKAELASTRGGRVQLLREMAGAPQEAGVTRLNEALLGGRNLGGLKTGVQALEGDVLTAEQQAQARADAIAASNKALGVRAQDALTAYATAKAKAEADARAKAAAEAQARAQAEAQARAQAEAQARAAAQAEAARQAAAQKAAADAAAKAAAQKAAVVTAPVTYESYGGGDSAGEGGGASDGGIGGTAGSGNDGGDSGGDAATAAGDAGSAGDSGGGGGGGKIICTLMNDFYGLPYNENKVWIKYAATHLKPEHQKGYHAVFLPLIDFAKKPGFLNEKVRDCLFYIGKHRTIDIQAELAGTYRRPVHKFLRSVIEPTLAFIGRLCK